MAKRLDIVRRWPEGFMLPSKTTITPKISIEFPLRLRVNGENGTTTFIESNDSLTGSWSDWQTILIGPDGSTYVEINDSTDKRFYRIKQPD